MLYSRQEEGKCAAQQAAGGIVYSTAGSRNIVYCTAGSSGEKVQYNRQQGESVLYSRQKERKCTAQQAAGR